MSKNCALEFLALLQGWLCVGVMFALSRLLRDVKNSVRSGRQSHGCLNVCRILFRATYNSQVLLQVRNLLNVQPGNAA